MNWNQFLMYADDPSDSGTWISGIYKIRSYSDSRYYAYYMHDSDKNWGWHVSEPPCAYNFCRYWPTLEAAKVACEEHAKNYTPKPATIRRALEVMNSFIPLATKAA